jgi:hypothetical protein
VTNEDSTIDQLAKRLPNLDDADRPPLCQEFLSQLQRDPQMRKTFKERLTTPFASVDEIALLKLVLKHTGCCDDWLLHLAGGVLLYNQCEFVYRPPICWEFAKRIPTIRA